jgi:hypothetical protein
MNTRSIKTVIIILLVTANIFLISNIAVLNLRVQNIPADMIENAAAILRERGIYADIKNIPARKPLIYIYEGVFSEYIDIVKNFSGASDEEIISPFIPEGAAFNVGEYRFIFEDSMQIKIVKADYGNGATVDETEILTGYDNFNRNEAGRVERIIRDFLRRYPDQDTRTGFNILQLKRDGDSDIVLINQTADNFLIASHSAYVIINDEEVQYFSGRWYFGMLTGRYEMPLLDSVNILFKSLEQDGPALIGARLENMEKEYNILKPHGIDTFYFTPSWAISFDDGRRFSYNMIRGAPIN